MAPMGTWSQPARRSDYDQNYASSGFHRSSPIAKPITSDSPFEKRRLAPEPASPSRNDSEFIPPVRQEQPISRPAQQVPAQTQQAAEDDLGIPAFIRRKMM